MGRKRRRKSGNTEKRKCGGRGGGKAEILKS
jgi:hypothetical protein